MIRRNIAANYIGRVWGIVSVYLFVPFYINILGIEAYGLIGFYSLLLGVFAFADLGFTATLKRELARLSVSGCASQVMRDTVKTYELSYAIISTSISALIWAIAPLIAANWLQTEAVSIKEASTAIRLMGIAVSLQMPSGLYIGGLVGLEKQVLANTLQILWGIVRGAGAILILWQFSATITAFALWQVATNAAYCIAARYGIKQSIKPLGPSSFQFEVLKTTWRYAFGMLGMAAISTILTQADKLIISKILTLEMLGYYTLAGALGSAPRLFASPIIAAVFPRLTGMVVLGDRGGLSRLYHRTSEIVALAVIPAGLTLAVFSQEVIFAWTGSRETSNQAALVASLLVAGQIIQEVLAVPYNLALSHGNVSINLKFGAVSVIAFIPLVIFLVKHFGILGAGASWLIMNAVTLVPYILAIHRHFLPGEAGRWFRKGFIMPMIASAFVILVCRFYLSSDISRLMVIICLVLVWLLSSIIVSFVMPDLRNTVFQLVGLMKARMATRLFGKTGRLS